MEKRPCRQEDFENCSVFKSEGACRSDTHHKYWPKRAYKTKIEKEFRELEVNKVFICRALHNAIHRGRPPQKPTREEMLDEIYKTYDGEDL